MLTEISGVMAGLKGMKDLAQTWLSVSKDYDKTETYLEQRKTNAASLWPRLAASQRIRRQQIQQRRQAGNNSGYRVGGRTCGGRPT